MKGQLKYLQNVIMTPNEAEKIGRKRQLLTPWQNVGEKNSIMIYTTKAY